MMYLMNQLWVWLLLALILGLIVGWLTCEKEQTKWWTGWVPWGTAAFLIGVLAAILKWLPARQGYMLDAALLLFASYIIGCCIGCLIKQARMGAGDVPVAVGSGIAAGSLTKSVAGYGKPSTDMGGKPVTPPPAPPDPKPGTPVTPPPPPPEPKPSAPVTPPPKPDDFQLKNPDDVVPLPPGDFSKLSGRRPAALAGPRGGVADDLKRIRGIGKQNEGRLHALGIWHFDQIAAWVKDEIEWVGSYLAFPGRIEREEWVSQAKVLATGAETEFSKRVARGEVATSQDEGTKGQSNVADLSAITNAAPKSKN